MNTVTQSIMRRCQGGQPTGIQGGSAVGPSFLDATFHCAQARLKSNPHCGLRAESSRPLFCPELAGIEPKDRDQRLAEYHRKLAHIEEIAA